MTYLSLHAIHWNDYEVEVKPAYDALIGGHLLRFLTLAPAYGGSVEMRAPFALLPSLWGGGADDVYRAVSIPCLVAAALVGVWLVGQMRSLGSGPLARIAALGLCVVNPITLHTVQIGHPEEILGGALCVGAVLAARRGQGIWAGLLLGAAIANKEWALLAIGPVLLALPERRALALAVAATVAAAFYVPLMLPPLLHHTALGASGPAAGSASGTTFQPYQLWWFLGSPGHLVTANIAAAQAIGYRHPPLWLSNIPHPLIIALSVPLGIGARIRRSNPLLLLALLFALRCALDPWDVIYYPVPLLLTLVAWESLAHRRPPVISLLATLLVWLVFVRLPGHLSVDQLALAFAALAVPGIITLAMGVFRLAPPFAGALMRPRRRSTAASAAA
jgi:hypothetical protein